MKYIYEENTNYSIPIHGSDSCQWASKISNLKPQTFSGYLFSYFEGGGDKNLQEQLRFAVSEDAKNWYALNGNRPIIASDTISESGGIRDPHILRGEVRQH